MPGPADLKGGHRTGDRRLDRIPQHDARNRSFPAVTGPVATYPPRGYTWSCGLYLDQGHQGACVGHAIAHEMAARPVVVDYGVCDEARWDIYHEAQRIDPWPGGAYDGAAPFYEGTSVLAGMQAATAAGFYTGYTWVWDEPSLALAVGYKGPAVLGIDWLEGMFRPDRDGYLNLSGEVVGGHAILCNGISISGGYYKLHNSWSAAWGTLGAAKVRRADMARLLDGAEAAIPVRNVR